MPTVSLTGNDTVIINGTIFNDLADAACAALTFPQTLTTIKTGKNQLGNWVQNLIGYTIPRDLTQKIVIKYKGENIYSSFIEINNK